MAAYEDPSYYGSDERFGGDEDDTFLYEGGDDKFDGGLGADTVSINANRSDAVVTTNSAGVTYVDLVDTEGYNSTLTLLNTEQISFLDQGILVANSGDNGNGILSLIVSSSGDIYEPGSILTAGTVSNDPDSDGLILGYQWRRKTPDDSIFSNIEGATQSTYEVTPEDEGFVVDLKVSYRDGRGYESTLISETTPVISQDESSPAETPGDPGQADPAITINDIDLGTINGSLTDGGEVLSYSGLIQSDNSFDGLRFSLDSDSYTYFDLTNLASDLDLYLYRDNPEGMENDLLYTSDTIGLDDERFFKYLSADNYAVFVVPYDAYPEGGYKYTLEIDTQTFFENSVLPNDPEFDKQWHLFNTGQGSGVDNYDIYAPEAWKLRSSSPDVVVAVIDGGIDLNHPDLFDNLWVNPGEIPDNGIDDDGNSRIDDVFGWNFYYDTNDINVTSGGDNHGTHVAGAIGATGDNAIGVTGVTWDVNLMSLTVFEANAPGAGDVLGAIRYAADMGAKVINMSLGWQGGYQGTIDEFIAQYPEYHSDYLDALTYAVDKGATVVIAAGNDSLQLDGKYISPPAYFAELIPGVISVAAVANTSARAGYSNYGHTVTIGAPGGDFESSGSVNIADALYSTSPVDPQPIPGYEEAFDYMFTPYYAYMDGTSMAAPVVSGAVALLYQEDPSLTPAEIEDILVASSTKLRSLEGITQEGAYLNLYEALNYTRSNLSSSAGNVLPDDHSSGSGDTNDENGSTGESPTSGGESSSGGSSGSSGSGSSSGGSSGSSSTPITPIAPAPPVVPIPEQAQPEPEAPISPVTVSPVLTPQSPVLGVQPEEAVTTVKLTTPISVRNLQFTQVVVGTPLRDVLTGSDQGEVLAGGGGMNQMTGGGGPDAFLFETPGEFGKRKADVITDFSRRDGDVLAVSQETFGAVSRIKFTSVTGKRQVKLAGRTNKNFIYDEGKGMLYYDGNGKKNGWGDGGEFVKLLGSPEIDKTDIAIL